MTQDAASPAQGRVPLAVTLGFTAFMAVLVPVYWAWYGPTNFLYFCDVALFLTLAGLWTGAALPISMGAVGITASQAIWVIDFLAGLVTGTAPVGIAAYMFNADSPLFLRGLSLFHGWLPFLLLYLVWRLGYDRRAFWAWTVLAWALILFCFLFMPPPNPNPGLTPVNINYVWGPDDTQAQTFVHPTVWVAGLMVALPLFLYAPVHGLLLRLAPRAPSTGAA